MVKLTTLISLTKNNAMRHGLSFAVNTIPTARPTSRPIESPNTRFRACCVNERFFRLDLFPPCQHINLASTPHNAQHWKKPSRVILRIQCGENQQTSDNKNLSDLKAVSQMLMYPLQVSTCLITIQLEYMESTCCSDDRSRYTS